MALKCPASAISLVFRINVQHDPRNVAPVGTFLVGIKHTKIGDDMLLVVCGERWTGGREIGDIGRAVVFSWAFSRHVAPRKFLGFTEQRSHEFGSSLNHRISVRS